jgi:CDP-glucose 4,6-dehydratase
MRHGKPGNMKQEQLELLEKTYRGRKVFITGHTGFKGSWMISWLQRLGAVVKGYALAPDGPQALYNVIDGNTLIQESVIGDINDSSLVKQHLLDFQPDFVFHLAAQPLVKDSYMNPVGTFQTNVIGTVNVLEAIRFLEKKCSCIFVTTDKVYENKEWHHPYRESDTLGGHDPYSASKAASELVIASYRSSYFNSSQSRHHIASVRAGNVIGGGDWSNNRIIPDMIRAFSRNKTLQVRNPLSVRPWQHVIEPVGAYLLIGALLQDNPQFAVAWNIGPDVGDNVSVGQLIDIARKTWGTALVEYTTGNVNHPHEAGLLKLDIGKAQAMLSWTPTLSIEQAVEMTVRWYKNFLDGQSAWNLVKEDLDRYHRHYLKKN